MPATDKHDNLTSDAMAVTSAAVGALDKLLTHRTRLGACVLLSMNECLNFARCKALLRETDGNLGAQLRKLEQASYVSVEKRFEARKPITWYRLTERGREALKAHLAALSVLVNAVN